MTTRIMRCQECEEEIKVAEADIQKVNCDCGGMKLYLITKRDHVAEVPCSVGLYCRVRSEGETMRSGDIVLISDTFRPLGFHTSFYHYFAGLAVVEGMAGKIICKAE